MPIWIVKATWIEDEADVSEQWEVNAPTALDAVREATAHIRFQSKRGTAGQRRTKRLVKSISRLDGPAAFRRSEAVVRQTRVPNG